MSGGQDRAVFVSDTFLTAEEVAELSGRRRYGAQARALAKMTIPYTVRPDGRPMVLRSHVENRLGGKRSEEPYIIPDWSAFDDVTA
jgi:hypothetical protein